MSQLSVKIDLGDKTRVYRFAETMHVNEACQEIMDNSGVGDETYGLYEAKSKGKAKARWLLGEKTFKFYRIQTGDV